VAPVKQGAREGETGGALGAAAWELTGGKASKGIRALAPDGGGGRGGGGGGGGKAPNFQIEGGPSPRGPYSAHIGDSRQAKDRAASESERLYEAEQRAQGRGVARGSERKKGVADLVQDFVGNLFGTVSSPFAGKGLPQLPGATTILRGP